MPSNYNFIGLIHLALPNARIIHVLRDPVDTCISCFSKLFSGEQNHTYDLAEIGRYYRRYQQLMAHWQNVLPTGSIGHVRYEDIVADEEGQARRIIEYCGLPWDNVDWLQKPSARYGRRAQHRCAAPSIKAPLAVARLSGPD